MATFLYLRGTSTPSSKIHPNNKAAISKSEIDSVPFGVFCVISDNLTHGIHCCLHTMSSRSSVPPIHTPLQNSPDESINAMYDGSPGISSVSLVGSAAVSCSNFCIPSTGCLTDVYFSMFTHYGSLPSASFTVVNIPFAVGMPMVA